MGSDAASLETLARQLVRLEKRLVQVEREMSAPLRRVAAEGRASARNLVHYVALRRQDLRGLQAELSRRGLSSLGRSESCVMGSLLEVAARAHESLALVGDTRAAKELARLVKTRSGFLSWETANKYLHRHTHDALGPRPAGRHIYIMVTAPPAAEATSAWMARMLTAGMNVLRINCAHEGEREWLQTIRGLRAARVQTGRSCRVLMDLAGPKIRTGPVAAGRHVATWGPARDELGAVTAPARVVIRRGSTPQHDGSPAGQLLISDEGFAKIRPGDTLRFRDTREKKRTLVVHEVDGDQLVCASDERAYLLGAAKARLFRGGKPLGTLALEVPAADDPAIDVRTGDPLVLTRRATAGRAPRRDHEGRVEQPGQVACTLPAALDNLKVGHRVMFDDGKIHAVVARASKDRESYLLRVVGTQKETVKLRAEKGINLPDTPLAVPGLAAEDRRALAFVARHANAVSLSFVRGPDDVRLLHTALDRMGRKRIAIVLKIETRAGFENLPRILLEGLRRPPLAVMIARGDLAVEVGFERLAELQEEILWLCEAAHVPTIWATQVLDTLARTGVPSRAEVTDAAASVAAECVMLNKGPFVGEAVRVLADILGRMEKHHYKKRSLFRKLDVAR